MDALPSAGGMDAPLSAGGMDALPSAGGMGALASTATRELVPSIFSGATTVSPTTDIDTSFIEVDPSCK
jgi:hypothetical protein